METKEKIYLLRSNTPIDTALISVSLLSGYRCVGRVPNDGEGVAVFTESRTIKALAPDVVSFTNDRTGERLTGQEVNTGQLATVLREQLERDHAREEAAKDSDHDEQISMEHTIGGRVMEARICVYCMKEYIAGREAFNGDMEVTPELVKVLMAEILELREVK